jgi:hypothetical protein
MMLELVAMLFDGLFEDWRLSASLKGLLGRLQLSIFKAALADKTLFDGGPHPVRRLVDELGQLGLRLPRDLNASSPIFPRSPRSSTSWRRAKATTTSRRSRPRAFAWRR